MIHAKPMRWIWVFMAVVGAVSLAFRMITGERLTGYGSYVSWGLWVAIYFHLVGMAGGVMVATVAGLLLGKPWFHQRYRTLALLSAASMAAGLFAIWVDLGHPFRAWRMGLAPNFGSLMAFNSWTYAIFLAILGWTAWKWPSKGMAQPGLSAWWKPLVLVVGFLGVAFPSQGGAFFGVVEAKPFWNSALIPVLSLCSALACGAAAIVLLIRWLGDDGDGAKQARRFGVMIAIGAFGAYLVAEFSEFAVAFWSHSSHLRESADIVLFGDYWWVFWFVHLGGAAGVFALYAAKSERAKDAASLLLVVSMLSTRLNVLVPGQAVEGLKGLSVAFHHPRLTLGYQATLLEYGLGFGAVALLLGMVYIGQKMLDRSTTHGA